MFRILFIDSSTTMSMKESNSLSFVEQSSSSVIMENPEVFNEQIEIDREVVTDSHNIVIAFDSLMANTKQTARKASNGQGSPARFPNHGKPGGKATRHMMATSKDGNNNSSDGSSGSGSDNEKAENQVQNTIRAEKHRRVWGGKARIYKRPKGIVRKYQPGVGALKEIHHYQREYSVICSKSAVARLVRELCEKKDLCWQEKAIMALHEAFEDYLVGLFEDCVLEAIHRKKVTVMPKDMFIALHIRGDTDRYKGSISM